MPWWTSSPPRYGMPVTTRPSRRQFLAASTAAQESARWIQATVADGPYPETKPVIGGFSILEVASHEEALE